MNVAGWPRVISSMALGALALTVHAQLPAPASAPTLSQDAPVPESPTVQVHVRELLVPVVVRDAQGRAVADLKQDDFKVFDQGKPRKMIGITVQRSPAAEAARPIVAPASPAPPATGLAAPSPTPLAAGTARTITFLFDDRHLGIGDLEEVKSAAAKMLSAPLPDADRALVLSFLGVNSGLTHNHAALQAAVEKLKARQAFQTGKLQCPDIDYYAADQILNKHNENEFQIALEKAGACSHVTNADMVRQSVETSAREALEIGDQDARETLAYVRDVVRTVAKFPGERTLILVSPGFLSSSDDALTLQSQIMDMAAAGHVTVSALDARGLYSGLVPASQNGPHSAMADMTGQPLQSHLESARDNEEVMAGLADGTGGTYFHRSNDLEGGLQAFAAGPEALYTLDISLQDVKPNGAYHALKVEVDRKDVKVQARRGYFAPLPAKK